MVSFLLSWLSKDKSYHLLRIMPRSVTFLQAFSYYVSRVATQKLLREALR
ncbi:hypothetical protein DESHY_60183 [Desulforamulus hydrothermalis Lam5 = DSM 18033]|uniref:Uncharacterized protein n=1 Tax=Desulforamulus hydrothermalis Lam5 = DSM 18033 TaxID=1121428 RepID=K8EKD0_9FIRM|nr:hypothetical protein DESHY_60183 [Desulforamulus hydrothermalis Lam5 = DSM 18033]